MICFMEWCWNEADLDGVIEIECDPEDARLFVVLCEEHSDLVCDGQLDI